METMIKPKIKLNPLQVGKVTLPNNLLLAPMAGISNVAYRRIAKEHGAGFAYTEMISSYGVVRGNQKTFELARVDEKERPVAIQIFGADEEVMACAAQIIEPACDIIDINFGCPAPKVTANECGAAMLKNPPKLKKIVSSVVKAASCPVTVKFRSGWDEGNINATEIAKTIEDSDAAAITIHPRTRAQGFEGAARWELIAAVKDSVSIPVIGNGDIEGPEDVKAMFEKTGCDGVMIGRGALGNPWIFSRTMEYLQTGIVPPEPTEQERLDMLLLFAKKLIQLKGERIAMKEIRQHVVWYVKGLPYAHDIRRRSNHVETYRELEDIVAEYRT